MVNDNSNINNNGNHNGNDNSNDNVDGDDNSNGNNNDNDDYSDGNSNGNHNSNNNSNGNDSSGKGNNHDGNNTGNSDGDDNSNGNDYDNDNNDNDNNNNNNNDNNNSDGNDNSNGNDNDNDNNNNNNNNDNNNGTTSAMATTTAMTTTTAKAMTMMMVMTMGRLFDSISLAWIHPYWQKKLQKKAELHHMAQPMPKFPEPWSYIQEKDKEKGGWVFTPYYFREKMPSFLSDEALLAALKEIWTRHLENPKQECSVTNFKRLKWKHIGQKAMHEELELYHTEKEIPLAHLEEVQDQVNSGEYDAEFFEKQGLSGDNAFHQAIQQRIPSNKPASSPFHLNTTTPQPSPPSPKPSHDNRYLITAV
ncbi:Anaphase-promoting complex subunit 1 [Balamuthia mandrillaris]